MTAALNLQIKDSYIKLILWQPALFNIEGCELMKSIKKTLFKQNWATQIIIKNDNELTSHIN